MIILCFSHFPMGFWGLQLRWLLGFKGFKVLEQKRREEDDWKRQLKAGEVAGVFFKKKPAELLEVLGFFSEEDRVVLSLVK